MLAVFRRFTASLLFEEGFFIEKIRKIYIEKIEKKIVKKFLKNHKILLTTYSDIDIIKTVGIFALSEVNFKE